MQEREYASFSSLKWERATAPEIGPHMPHRWRWKDYQVWGIGCEDDDKKGHDCFGGVWFASHNPKAMFRSQADAQAAVETYELERMGPQVSMDDVETVWEVLNEVVAMSFEEVMKATGFEAGLLSDLVSRGYELQIIRSDWGIGFRRETRRRK